MLACSSLATIGGAAADAGTARTPIQVGVTVTTPCEIHAPVSISLDATGHPTLVGDALAPDCGVVPEVAIAADVSKGTGYVVSISF